MGSERHYAAVVDAGESAAGFGEDGSQPGAAEHRLTAGPQQEFSVVFLDLFAQSGKMRLATRRSVRADESGGSHGSAC